MGRKKGGKGKKKEEEGEQGGAAGEASGSAPKPEARSQPPKEADFPSLGGPKQPQRQQPKQPQPQQQQPKQPQPQQQQSPQQPQQQPPSQQPQQHPPQQQQPQQQAPRKKQKQKKHPGGDEPQQQQQTQAPERGAGDTTQRQQSQPQQAQYPPAPWQKKPSVGQTIGAGDAQRQPQQQLPPQQYVQGPTQTPQQQRPPHQQSQRSPQQQQHPPPQPKQPHQQQPPPPQPKQPHQQQPPPPHQQRQTQQQPKQYSQRPTQQQSQQSPHVKSPSPPSEGQQEPPVQALRQLQISPDTTIVPKMTTVCRTGGKSGRPINVITNHFPLILGNLQQAYHYDVTINPDRPKKLYRKIVEELRCKYYNTFYPAFDGAKNMYSARRLPFKNDEFSGTVKVSEDEREKEFTVGIKFATNVDLSCLRDYLKQAGRININTPMQALQCLDVVLRSAPSLTCIPCGRSYFTLPKGRPHILGDGSELYYGFYQSAILGWKPFLNVDVAHKAFPMALNIIDLLYEMFPNIDLHQELTMWDKEALGKHLRMLKVSYEIPNNPASRRVYRVNDLGKPAGIARFPLDGGSGQQITVVEYFQNEKKVRLQYPKLPTLWVGSKTRENPILLPCEFCTVLAGQAVNRKMTETQTRNMIRKAATNTDVRKENILSAVYQANYNQNNTVREFGLSVSTQPEQVRARVLQPPELSYKSNKVRVSKGVWRANMFQNGAVLNKWTIMCADRRTRENKLYELEDMLVRSSRELGMSIDPAIKPFSTLQLNDRKMFEELKAYFQQRKDYQLIVVVISEQKNLYQYVKQASEIAVGCLTQCIKGNTVFKLNQSTVGNILLKLNAKLNGLNHSLFSRPPCLSRPCMIMGADVTHPSPDLRGIPSVAAVTASCDPSAFKYNFAWRLQLPTVEIIGDLQAITREHLLYFYNRNRGSRPERIIFFRDGVSDGQFEQVLSTELQAIRKACSSLQVDYKPKISFLVVQKRHHTRFFPVDKRDSEDRNFNVPAGTCVDTVVTHPAAQDFYLVSHASIQGVAKPTKYRTLWDDADMSDDEIEQLSFYLCHLFARCTRSVSYPAPTYYAHLAAARAKAYCETRVIDMDHLTREQEKLKVQDCIIKDLPMFFV